MKKPRRHPAKEERIRQRIYEAEQEAMREALKDLVVGRDDPPQGESMADIEVRIIKEITLYPHKSDSGRVQLGWQTNVTGMQAGPSPLMCRILVPEQFGDYPEGWFPVQSEKSQTKIIKELEDGFITVSWSYQTNSRQPSTHQKGAELFTISEALKICMNDNKETT